MCTPSRLERAMNAILDADLSYIRNSEMQEEALV